VWWLSSQSLRDGPDGKSAHNGSKESKSVYNATCFGSQNGNPSSKGLEFLHWREHISERGDQVGPIWI
jgi:hypothetical protein